MLLAQFGSKTVQMHKPVWLGGLAETQFAQNPTAKEAQIDAAWIDYFADGYGAWRAPLATAGVDMRSLVHCTNLYTADELERQLSRYVGTKDYLVGYRYASCQCGMCGDCLSYCHYCGTERTVTWFARRARLQNVTRGETPMRGLRDEDTPSPIQLTWTPDTPWQLMDDVRWAWGMIGDSQAHFEDDYDLCNPQEVTEYKWPCVWPPCTKPPPFRFYMRPRSWKQRWCVGYWTAGRWIRAAMDEKAIIIVPGDVPPLSRLAFTNFTELTVRVCSPTGFEYSFTCDQVVGEPQYLMISPYSIPQIRYCPIHDDECIDAVPGTYADVARDGTPVALSSATRPVVGELFLGRNILYFSGFRLPGHPFHYAYDIIPQYV